MYSKMHLILTCCQTPLCHRSLTGPGFFIIGKDLVVFTQSGKDFIHAQEGWSSAKVSISFDTGPVKIWGTLAQVQHFFISGLEQAITDVIAIQRAR
jgi:hypothetical protein